MQTAIPIFARTGLFRQRFRYPGVFGSTRFGQSSCNEYLLRSLLGKISVAGAAALSSACGMGASRSLRDGDLPWPANDFRYLRRASLADDRSARKVTACSIRRALTGFGRWAVPRAGSWPWRALRAFKRIDWWLCGGWPGCAQAPKFVREEGRTFPSRRAETADFRLPSRMMAPIELEGDSPLWRLTVAQFTARKVNILKWVSLYLLYLFRGRLYQNYTVRVLPSQMNFPKGALSY